MKRNKLRIESAAAKPNPCTILLANTPQELKDRSQWVLWGYRCRNDRWTKIPYRPDGKETKANDPSTWHPFDSVCASLDAGGNMRGTDYDGIGYEFAADDPYTGIDLDDAIDPDTNWLKPWAQTIVDQLRSYTEISPSGSGVKIWVRAKKPSNDHCRCKHEDGEVEVYDSGRYFAMTGQHWPNTPLTIEERQTEVDALYHQLFGKQHEKKSRREPIGKVKPETRPLADGELIDKAKAAKNGDKFARLLTGDTSGYDGDDSRADAALCAMLAFWTDRNAEQMDRLFRSSGLMRAKWDERRGVKTYGQRTLDEACQLVQETYCGNRGRPRRSVLSVNGNGHSRQSAGANAFRAGEEDMVLPEADDDPHRLANGFLQRLQKEQTLTLRYWREEFLRWDGRAYRTIVDAEICSEATQYVRHEFERLYRRRRLEWTQNSSSSNGKAKPLPPVQKVTVKLMADVL